MARVNASTVLTDPATLRVVVLYKGDEVPEWAEVGEHLLEDTDPADATSAGSGPEPESQDDEGKTPEPDRDHTDADAEGGAPDDDGEADADAEGDQDDEGETPERPDTTWKAKELKSYAEANDIDLGSARSKADILAVING